MSTTTATRKIDLPAAPCRICGMPVPAGKGTRIAGTDLNDSPRMSYLHGRGPEYVNDWTRAHGECESTNKAVLEKITGMKMTTIEADQVVRAVGIAPVAVFVRTAAKRRPFDFVDPRQVDEYRVELGKIRRRGKLKKCSTGACGLCGVSRATAWHTGPLKWSDGSPAPFCGDCSKAWMTASRPRELEGIRQVGLTEFCGVPRFIGVHNNAFGLRVYAELAGDDHVGHDDRFSYKLEALAEVRRAAWTAHPSCAPDDTRRAMWTKISEARSARANAAYEASQEAEKVGGTIDWSR